MSNTGINNWTKPYIPGRETAQSLLRFVPHDEDESSPEYKRTYGTPRSRRRKRRGLGSFKPGQESAEPCRA